MSQKTPVPFATRPPEDPSAISRADVAATLTKYDLEAWDSHEDMIRQHRMRKAGAGFGDDEDSMQWWPSDPGMQENVRAYLSVIQDCRRGQDEMRRRAWGVRWKRYAEYLESMR